MDNSGFLTLYKSFLETYNTQERDDLWQQKSKQFKKFWQDKIINPNAGELADYEIDEVVRILDRNAKGNTSQDEAVARAMITMGVWRRMFREVRQQNTLHNLLTKIFEAKDTKVAISLINELYEKNEKNKNGLTGSSGNMLNAMIFTYTPSEHTSVVSLNHRRKIIEYFGFTGSPDFDISAPGEKIVLSDDCIINGFRTLGITESPRTISWFLYKSTIHEQWNMQKDDEITWRGNRRGESTEEDLTVFAPASSSSTDPALFYMESQLEDFLIQNWEKTELGKRYDLIEENGELVSQQYQTDIGRIDILAKNKNSKQLVVIELKKNQTSDDTVGQIMRYMGWLEEHKTNGKPTEGIIIAAQYDDRLYYALKRAKDIEVYLYKVDFKLEEFKKHS